MLQVPAHDVLQRRRGEKELLPQTQFLARRVGICRIEHAGDGTRLGAFLQRPDVIARVEPVEKDRVDWLRAPEPQRVDPRPAPAHHGRIESHGVEVFGGMPHLPHAAIGLLYRLDIAAEADFIGAFAAFEFPRIAVSEPVLRQFDLPSIAHFLAEQPVDIANAIAEGRYIHRRHGFQETRRQTPQTAITQRGVGLTLDKIVDIDVERGERFAHRFHHPDIGHGIAHQPTDQEFEAEVIDALFRRPPGIAARFHPLVDDPVPHSKDRGGKPIGIARDDRVLADRIGQLFQYFVAEGFGISGARLRPGNFVTDWLLRHLATHCSCRFLPSETWSVARLSPSFQTHGKMGSMRLAYE